MLLHFLDLASVLQLALAEFLLEEVLQGEVEVHVLGRHVGSQLRLTLSLLCLLEIHTFADEVAVQLLRNKLGTCILFECLLDKVAENDSIFVG